MFDSTLLSNVRYGDLDATPERIRASAAELGLGDWLDGLPQLPAADPPGFDRAELLARLGADIPAFFDAAFRD